jgi:hypothetical protein
MTGGDIVLIVIGVLFLICAIVYAGCAMMLKGL